MNILLADDDPDIRQTYSEIISTLGHNVFTAADGVDAIAILNADAEINIVITDIEMPHLNGIELLKWIRKNHQVIMVVLISGYSNSNIGKICSELDVVFFNKPLNLEALIELLNQFQTKLEGNDPLSKPAI